MRWHPSSLLLAALCVPLSAQTLDTPGAIKAAIEAKYHVTQATADYTDIVTAGDVITLLKSGLVMYDSTKPTARTGNVSYHDGKLNAGGMTRMMLAGNNPNSAVQAREFVSGEKCWLVSVTVKEEGLYLTFLSDPIRDIRFMGSIKFPFDKKEPMPGPDIVLARVAEVITAQPAPEPGVPSSAPAAAPPPIAPPPPPADQPAAPPPTISLGQAKADVVSSLGQPTKVVTLGTKEIDYYPDMKITYVNGKVADVQ